MRGCARRPGEDLHHVAVRRRAAPERHDSPPDRRCRVRGSRRCGTGSARSAPPPPSGSTWMRQPRPRERVDKLAADGFAAGALHPRRARAAREHDDRGARRICPDARIERLRAQRDGQPFGRSAVVAHQRPSAGHLRAPEEPPLAPRERRRPRHLRDRRPGRSSIRFQHARSPRPARSPRKPTGPPLAPSCPHNIFRIPESLRGADGARAGGPGSYSKLSTTLPELAARRRTARKPPPPPASGNVSATGTDTSPRSNSGSTSRSTSRAPSGFLLQRPRAQRRAVDARALAHQRQQVELALGAGRDADHGDAPAGRQSHQVLGHVRARRRARGSRRRARARRSPRTGSPSRRAPPPRRGAPRCGPSPSRARPPHARAGSPPSRRRRRRRGRAGARRAAARPGRRRRRARS